MTTPTRLFPRRHRVYSTTIAVTITVVIIVYVYKYEPINYYYRLIIAIIGILYYSIIQYIGIY